MKTRLTTRAIQVMALLCFFASAQAGFGVTTLDKRDSIRAAEFHTDPHVRKQVRFWEAVFQRYDATSVIIHDVDEPLAMIDVINFNRYVQNDGSITNIANSDQNEIVKKYILRYDLAVDRFKKYADKAVRYGAIEQRIFEVYQRDPQSLIRLYRGDVKFRAQAGMADTFIRAAQRAQEYLPYMEDTFKRMGVPTQLTRLPFVESMFNLSARSKVGASGIWQFMPDTAREYMSVNTVVDERNNPYKATIAAAQLLQTNFRELGSWPLAVTAYNHGRGGMQRATRETGTTQLGTIINNYRSPTFGFASKNFYSEFIAAVNTYALLEKQGKVVKVKKKTSVDQVVLNRPMSIKEISTKTKLPYDQLALLNPCINPTAFTSKAHVPLPPNYVLRLSKEAAKNLKKQRIASAIVQPGSKTTARR